MREYGEIRKRLLGDESLAIQYIGLGRKFLGILKRIHIDLGGLPQAVRQLRFDNGLIITVEHVHGQDTVTIDVRGVTEELELDCITHVESGNIQHLSVAPLHPNSYKPSILHYTDYVRANMPPSDSSENGWNGDVEFVYKYEGGSRRLEIESDNWDDGEESRSFGCPANARVKTITGTHPLTGDSETWVDPEAVFCSSGSNYADKDQTVQLPPGLFTGKLRHVVQSLYGAGDAFNDFIGSHLSINYANTSVLRTTEDYTYYLLKITKFDGLKIYKINLDNCGNAIRAWMKASIDSGFLTGDKIQMVETFIFPHIKPDIELVQTVVFSNVELGGPWYYGWKANKSGDECSVVVTQPSINSTGGNIIWESSLLRISVAENPAYNPELAGSVPFIVSDNIEEGPTEYQLAVNRDLIWWPNRGIGGMDTIAMHPNDGSVATISPQYCFYDIDDNLEVVYFTNSGAAGTVNYPDGDAQTCGPGTDCGYNSAFMTGEKIHGFFTSKYDAVGNNHSMGGTVEEVNSGPITSVFQDDRYGWLGKTPTTYCPDQDLGGYCDGPTFTDIVRKYYGPADYTSISGPQIKDHESMLIIPWYDCEAVYLGSLDIVNVTGGIYQHHWGNPYLKFDRGGVGIFQNWNYSCCTLGTESRYPQPNSLCTIDPAGCNWDSTEPYDAPNCWEAADCALFGDDPTDCGHYGNPGFCKPQYPNNDATGCSDGHERIGWDILVSIQETFIYANRSGTEYFASLNKTQERMKMVCQTRHDVYELTDVFDDDGFGRNLSMECGSRPSRSDITVTSAAYADIKANSWGKFFDPDILISTHITWTVWVQESLNGALSCDEDARGGIFVENHDEHYTESVFTGWA